MTSPSSRDLRKAAQRKDREKWARHLEDDRTQALRDKLREEYDAGLDDVDGRYSQEDSDARA